MAPAYGVGEAPLSNGTHCGTVINEAYENGYHSIITIVRRGEVGLLKSRTKDAVSLDEVEWMVF